MVRIAWLTHADHQLPYDDCREGRSC